MSIYQDKRTGIYYASYINPANKRVRVSLETRNKVVACTKEKEFLTKRQADDSPRVFLESFLARYRAFLKATRKPDTARHFEIGLKKLLAFKAIRYLDEITPALLDEFAISEKAKLKGPYAPGLNRSVRALITAMRQAEFWEMLPPQNWRRVSKFKEKKGRVEFHTPEEIVAILNHLGEDWEVVVLLGCRAGLRRGEMSVLKKTDVDFKNNQIYVAPNKTEGHRFVPMTPDLRAALEKAIKKSKNEYVVNVGDPSHRTSPYYLSAYYKKLTADLPFYCHLHKLRHTFASHLVQAGVDLYRVSKLMGHSTIKVTEIYAHLAPADLTSAVGRLPVFTSLELPGGNSMMKSAVPAI